MQADRIVVLNWKDLDHPEAGGAEVYCHNIATELVRSGATVTFVTSRPKGAARSSVNEAGYRVRRMGGTYTVYPLVLLWLLVNRRRTDAIIDSQNGIPFFSPLAARAGTAITLLIHHVHQDQFALYMRPALAAFGRWLEGWASRRVYRRRPVCVVSPSTRKEVRKRLSLAGPIHLTANGYRPVASVVLDRAETPTIVGLGRLVPHKRWHLAVEAVGRLRDAGVRVRFDLLGAGPERAALEEQIAALDLADLVHLHGFVPERVRDHLLGRAWLAVSTSVGEGWGLSVIEAAGQGVPTVAIDAPGLRDSVQPGRTGWLSSADELAATLRHALDEVVDEGRAASIGLACREWAASLRWSATADRFRAVLSSELKRHVLRRERRTARSDTSVIVTLSRELAARVEPHALRATDQLNFCPRCVEFAPAPQRLVLNGVDEQGAAAVLDRLGISAEHGAFSIRLCRSSEQVQWHTGTFAHNAPTLLTARACPDPATHVRPDDDAHETSRIAG